MWKYKKREALGTINDFLNFRISVLSKNFTMNTHCPIYSISSFQRQKEQIQPQQPIQALKQVKQPDSNTQVISQWTESDSKICLKFNHYAKNITRQLKSKDQLNWIKCFQHIWKYFWYKRSHYKWMIIQW